MEWPWGRHRGLKTEDGFTACRTSGSSFRLGWNPTRSCQCSFWLHLLIWYRHILIHLSTWYGSLPSCIPLLDLLSHPPASLRYIDFSFTCIQLLLLNYPILYLALRNRIHWNFLASLPNFSYSQFLKLVYTLWSGNASSRIAISRSSENANLLVVP